MIVGPLCPCTVRCRAPPACLGCFLQVLLLQIESPFQILRHKEVCETTGPVANELSKVYKADVHVFSDSVQCLAEIKFTERWKEHLAYYKDIAKRTDGETFQFTLNISWCQNERDSAQKR